MVDIQLLETYWCSFPDTSQATTLQLLSIWIVHKINLLDMLKKEIRYITTRIFSNIGYGIN